ncbi:MULTISPECIES: HD domain-containing protein [Nocardioides]|uniref:HD domain-containing protein n=1 Tax=Nocardioides vastitatis TaxID=2568655 RepID=A0ABW0ZEW2_9ACTN|nr:HD domain-containing protein [Nocardioides sp.]THJ08640.1 HD domain-containing protein [Nocardioides sp.]
MAAVGSPTWIVRTNGSLSLRDQLRFARAAVAREVVALPAAIRRRPEPRRVLDADRSPPDTRLARAMQQVSASALPAPLLGHSIRTWLWGSMLAEIDGIAYDDELLYVAALLHDLGLAPGHRPSPEAGCFAVHGAVEARDLLLDAGADAEYARRVCDAIAAHFNVNVPLDWGAEAHLLHGGAHVDVVGRRLGEIAASTVTQVLEREPRIGFADCFTQAMRTEAELRPGSRAGLLWRLGMERAIRRARFPTPAG